MGLSEHRTPQKSHIQFSFSSQNCQFKIFYGYIMVSVYTHIYPLSPTSDNPLVRRPGWKRSAAAGKLVLVFAAAAVAVACHCFSFRLPTGNMNNHHKNTQPSSKQHQIKVANKKNKRTKKENKWFMNVYEMNQKNIQLSRTNGQAWKQTNKSFSASHLHLDKLQYSDIVSHIPSGRVFIYIIYIYICIYIYVAKISWHSLSLSLSLFLSLSGVTDILSNILSGICSDILSDIFFCQSIWIYLVSILAWYSFWPSTIWHLFWHSIWHLFRHSIWHIFWHSLWHSLWHVFRSRRVPLHGSGQSVLHCIRSRHAPQHPGLAISPGVLHSIQSCVYYRSSGHWSPQPQRAGKRRRQRGGGDEDKKEEE